MERTNQLASTLASEGIKSLGSYWTLGRYDAVVLFEAPDEKAAMRLATRFSDRASTETLIALKREDAVKLLE